MWSRWMGASLVFTGLIACGDDEPTPPPPPPPGTDGGTQTDANVPPIDGIEIFDPSARYPTPSELLVGVSFSGDANADAEVTASFCNETKQPGCDPLAQTKAPMQRQIGTFETTLDLSAGGHVPGEVLSVAVVATDPDGVMGSPLTFTSTVPDFAITLEDLSLVALSGTHFSLELTFSGDGNEDATINVAYCEIVGGGGQCESRPSVPMMRSGAVFTADVRPPDIGGYNAFFEVRIQADDPDGVTNLLTEPFEVRTPNPQTTVLADPVISNITPTGFDVAWSYKDDGNGSASAVFQYCDATEDPSCDPRTDGMSVNLVSTIIDLAEALKEFQGRISGLSAPFDPGDDLNVRAQITDAEGVANGTAYTDRLHLPRWSIGLSDLTTQALPNSELDVGVTFAGDENDNAQVTLYYCDATSDSACDPQLGTSLPMVRQTPEYTALITGAPCANAPFCTLNLLVTATDVDGVDKADLAQTAQVGGTGLILTNLMVSGVHRAGFDVSVVVAGDSNDNSSAAAYFCNRTDNPGCDPAAGSSVPLTRMATLYSATIASVELSPTDDPHDTIAVVVRGSDADGVIDPPSEVVFDLYETWTQLLKSRMATINQVTSQGSAVAISAETAAYANPTYMAYILRNRASGPFSHTSVFNGSFGGDSEIGGDLATSGDFAVLGSRTYNGGLGVNSGRVAIRTYTSTTLSGTEYIRGSDTTTGDQFGIAVDIDGDIIAVGARDTDDLGVASGSVYVFRNTGGWTEETELHASNGASGDRFGSDVAVSGQTIAVLSDQGPYVYRYESMSWVESIPTPSDPVSLWRKIDIQGNRLVASASSATYVFVYDGVGWQQEQKITPPEVATSITLGADNTLVFGCSGAPDGGAAYVYYLIDGSWVQRAVLRGADTVLGDGFGRSIDMEDDLLIVGAPGDDHEGTNGSGIPYESSGAAYIFQLQ